MIVANDSGEWQKIKIGDSPIFVSNPCACTRNNTELLTWRVDLYCDGYNAT